MSDHERQSRGRKKPQASFPVAGSTQDLPLDYQSTLANLKQRIANERLRVTLSANAAMILLYWDIGQTILTRQDQQGWGAIIIDRLSEDLKEAFPEMDGFSPRNLKYMRMFAQQWLDREIVQRTVAQIPWRSNLTLLHKLSNSETRLWYTEKTIENGWSKNILAIQIEGRLHERQGKAANNFALTLPPGDSDMANQVFKDPYLFDFLGTADTRKEREVEQALVNDLLRHPDDKPTIGLLLCRSKSDLVVKYSLDGYRRPMGVAQWESEPTRSLPEDLKGSLPSIEQIEKELAGSDD